MPPKPREPIGEIGIDPPAGKPDGDFVGFSLHSLANFTHLWHNLCISLSFLAHHWNFLIFCAPQNLASPLGEVDIDPPAGKPRRSRDGSGFLGFCWIFLKIHCKFHTFMAYSLHFLQFSCTPFELLDFLCPPNLASLWGEVDIDPPAGRPRRIRNGSATDPQRSGEGDTFAGRSPSCPSRAVFLFRIKKEKSFFFS